MKKITSLLFDVDCITGRIIWVLIYIFLYDYIYEQYIYGVFSYMGNIDYIPMNITHRFIWVLVSILPMFFYHRINEISTFICLFVYIFVYIPFIHGSFVIFNIPKSIIYCNAIILCLYFILYFQIDRVPVIKNIQIKPYIPLYVVEIITIALTLFFIAFRAQSMHFVNIFTQMDMLYDLRAQNYEAAGERSLILYVQGWLTGAFYPFLLIWYLNQKNLPKILLILLGYLLLFMVDMKKVHSSFRSYLWDFII